MSRRTLLFLALVAVGLPTVGCGTVGHIFGSGCDSDPIAGNVGIGFFGYTQQSRDPVIEGGPDDPLGCAYGLLCATQRARVPEKEFRETRGGAVSRLVEADSHQGPTPYVDLGLTEEYPRRTNPPDDDRSTWIEYQATWYQHVGKDAVVAGAVHEEDWRVTLVREHDGWKVCDFTPLPGRQRDVVPEN